MDCHLIQVELVTYHLALDTMSDEQRDEMDRHLLSCPECLRAYLQLRRHLDVGARPRDSARTRLRDAVAARYRQRPLDRARRFVSRPIPLYQGFAAAAVIVLLAVLLPLLVRKPQQSAAPQATAGERIDTSRTTAESLNLY